MELQWRHIHVFACCGGAIALWLQAYPKLTPEDCLDVFSKTCTHYDSSLVYPNNLYGYGQIDVYEGLKEVLKKAAAGVETVENSDSDECDKRIYYLDGRYAGTSEKRITTWNLYSQPPEVCETIADSTENEMISTHFCSSNV